MPKEKSAGAIIFRKSDDNIYYLLLHYAPSEPGKHGHWGLAKGHVEGNESDEETARREIFEETGLKDVKIIPGFKETEKYFFRKVYGLEGAARKKAPWVFKMVIFFVAETEIEEIKISDEHTGFLWLPFDEAIKKISFKNSKKLLKKANDFIVQKQSS
jgi:8-oxo-dGTP pyrophosphatase MutT (NUDIX family)